MKRNVNRKMLLAVALGLLFSACTTGESIVKPNYNFGKVRKIAVVEVNAPALGEGSRNAIADQFNFELLKRGFDVVERTQVQKLTSEIDFQASDLTQDADRARLGMILNVPAIMVVNVPEVGSNLAITAKIVELETGSLLWVGNGTSKMKNEALALGGAVIGGIIGGVVGHQGDHAQEGAIGGAAAGAATGYLLQPHELEIAKKVIVKICENLPTVF